jgi:hypothetical protein
MCFSTEVSFGASAVLLGAGTATIFKIRKPSEIMFAAIPIIFAVQQFSEGMLWLSFSNHAYSSWQTGTTFAFLVFAQVFWPFWVPLSLLLLEKEAGRKKILTGLSVLGGIVAWFLAFRLIYFGASAEIIGHHIHYKLDFPYGNSGVTGIFYCIVTVIPLFVSGVRKMKILGIAIVASLFFTQLLFAFFAISVWCFFAAIISVIIYSIMVEIRKPLPEVVPSLKIV